jgi:tetratricopeptide (TPR) repeat protein
VLLAPAHAELLLQQGDAAGALREAEAALEAVKTLSLDLCAAVACERLRALAESQLGNHDAARSSIERMFALARELSYDGLPLAVLYEAQARVAIAAGAAQDCVTALTQLHARIDHAEAPALINAYEALREESRKQLALPELPAAAVITSASPTESTAMFTEVRTRLNAFNERQARAQQALELLLESSGARAGHLFLFDAGGLFSAASVGRQLGEEEMLLLAQKHVDAELGSTKTESVTVADLALSGATVSSEMSESESPVVPMLLLDGSETSPMLVGLALVARGEVRVRAPRSDLMRAISRCLQEAGDSVAVPL